MWTIQKHVSVFRKCTSNVIFYGAVFALRERKKFISTTNFATKTILSSTYIKAVSPRLKKGQGAENKKRALLIFLRTHLIWKQIS